MAAADNPRRSQAQQHPEKQQYHQYDLYEFTPTIDVLSDGSECTSVTIFLSIWRRRRRKLQKNHQNCTDDTAAPLDQRNQKNTPNSHNKRDLGTLVRRYALTGLTNGLGRLAADQNFSLSTAQCVICPLLPTSSTAADDGKNMNAPFAALEGLASLLFAKHQGGTLHQLTVVLVPFNVYTESADSKQPSSSTSTSNETTKEFLCPVEQIAKLMLNTKSTTSSCPIRTCHVPVVTSSEDSQKFEKQPWWMVYDDDLLMVHTKIISRESGTATATEAHPHNVVAVVFWYTLWCCESNCLSNAEPSSGGDKNAVGSARKHDHPYNLGVAVMSVVNAPEQIQDWFRPAPERNCPPRQPLVASSQLDALILVGPDLEASLSSSSPTSFQEIPLVLFANTTSSNGPTKIVFQRAFQQAQWLKSKFPSHIFVSLAQETNVNQKDEQLPTTQPSTTSDSSSSVVSLVSGTSIILSTTSRGGCQVVPGACHTDATSSDDGGVDTLHDSMSNANLQKETEMADHLQRIVLMQQALHDYEKPTLTALQSDTPPTSLVDLANSSSNNRHRHGACVKDDNEIDLDDDDEADESEDGAFGKNEMKSQTLPISALDEAAGFFCIPRLLVLGTGCASPSPLRGSSGYGIFLPHIHRNASSASPDDSCYRNNFRASAGQHLILTALLECGEDVVSQLYRLLPPPQSLTATNKDGLPSHDDWFDYQLRQIQFIWISHPHLDHYGGLPTLLRRIYEAHQHNVKERDKTPQICRDQRQAEKRCKSANGHPSFRRPLVIAPPRVLEYLDALFIPSEIYLGITQADYDKNTYWQRWISEITLTVYAPGTNVSAHIEPNHKLTSPVADCYRDYRPFSFLRHVLVDHGCAHAYGLFVGLAPCLWYTHQQQNESVQAMHARHPRFGDPHCRVLCFSGDTRPCRRLVLQSQSMPSIHRFALRPSVDWLIHEATFDDDECQMAHTKGHSTSAQALAIAQQLNAEVCLLTHFSQRYHLAIPFGFPANAQGLNENMPRVLFAFDGLFLPLLPPK